MKNSFKLLSLLLGFGMAFSFTACSDDDDNNGENENETTNVIVTDNITENTTWTSDNVYQLGGRIAVEAGATLTIEPGTIIKGEAGTGSNATALLIARDATIMAEGEATAPIIFTSVADEISPEDVAAGNFASPNLDPDINGLWGGVIVLGNAHISVGDGTTAQIEGIPSTDTNGEYGGTNDEDNSGVLKYISIRHGGSNIGEGNEINGLTLGGVGNKTVVENIEVVANQDDGIEWFGGTVNVSNVVVWNPGDDGLDTDQAWNGTCSNFAVIHPQGSLFELDGPEGTYINGNHTFTNGICKAGELGEELIDFDANTNVDMSNVYFYDVPNENIVVEEYTEMMAEGISSVSNLEYTLADGVDASVVFNGIDAAELTEVAEGQNTVGPQTSIFSWTWAASANAF
jgi:hypothetical protein